MVDFDKFKGISPEVIELSDDDVRKHDVPQVLLPDSLMKEVALSIDTKKFVEVCKSFNDVLRKETEKACVKILLLARSIQDYINTQKCIAMSPNNRIKHLALHSKKRRVRKKNIGRLLKEFYFRSNFPDIDEIHEHKIETRIIFDAPRLGGNKNDNNNN